MLINSILSIYIHIETVYFLDSSVQKIDSFNVLSYDILEMVTLYFVAMLYLVGPYQIFTNYLT